MNTKKCRRCDRELSLECFSKNAARSNGLNSYCRECHKLLRREHYLNNRQKYIDKAKKINQAFNNWWHEYKQQFSCQQCGENHPACIQFHHLDPHIKEAEISLLVHTGSKKAIMEELKKCIPLCANCHFKEHYKR